MFFDNQKNFSFFVIYFKIGGFFVKKLQKVLYYISIVPIVLDCVKSCIKGIVKGVNDVKKEAQDEWFAEQNAKFAQSFRNPVSDLENVKK